MRQIAILAVCIAACNKERSTSDIVIQITRDGYVKLGSEAVTLGVLADRLHERVRTGPFEEVAPGAKASALTVCLALDPDAAWRHVEFVRTILMEEKLHRLSFAGGRAAPLPIDSSNGGFVFSEAPPSPLV